MSKQEERARRTVEEARVVQDLVDHQKNFLFVTVKRCPRGGYELWHDQVSCPKLIALAACGAWTEAC